MAFGMGAFQALRAPAIVGAVSRDTFTVINDLTFLLANRRFRLRTLTHSHAN